MLRVPLFAEVGRLGLPVVAAATGAALWGTSWAMASSVPAGAVTVAMPQHSSGSVGGETVGVSIPSVVFGQGDGLGRQVTVGRHSAVVQVWLAAGSPEAVATVRSTDGRLRGCRSVRLQPARVNTLRCALDVSVTTRSLTLTVATSVAGQHFQATYEHRVAQLG